MAQDIDKNSPPIEQLLAVMRRLRDPDSGCAWDLEQNFKSIAPYTIEEAYEVEDAINHGDMDDLKDELGDLLLQVVFHAQMAADEGLFSFDDVARTVTDKMISRHPHVFGDNATDSAEGVVQLWEERKDLEKKRRQAESILDDIPRNLPALIRAHKIQKRVARVGFDWENADQVLDKFEEEIAEMRQALKDGRRDEIEDEIGDLFFVLTNFARVLDINSEEAARHANEKFIRRFKYIEQRLKEKNITLRDATLGQMEELWQEQKKLEKAS